MRKILVICTFICKHRTAFMAFHVHPRGGLHRISPIWMKEDMYNIYYDTFFYVKYIVCLG